MPDRPTYFVDRCLGKVVPNVLRAAGTAVELHDDHFPQDARDEKWIPEVSRREWVILTKDRKIRHRTEVWKSAIESNARIFMLFSGNLSGSTMGEVFLAQLSAMEAIALGLKPPFVAVVFRDGLEIVYPRPNLQGES